MTAALEGGEWSAAHTGCNLPPGKTRYPFYRRLGGPQGRSGQAENLIPTGIRSRTVQPIVSRYTDWATRPTFVVEWFLIILFINCNWVVTWWQWLFYTYTKYEIGYLYRCTMRFVVYLSNTPTKWGDNIRMDLQGVGCGYMDWIGLAQDRDRWQTFVSAVMNLWVPWNAGNFLTSCKPVSFSRRTLLHGISK